MSDKPSKFSALLKTRQETDEPSEAHAPEATSVAPVKARRPKAPVEARRSPGRPGGQGKRLNPDYSQVTAYIPTKLHTDTKINLLRLSEKKEFSDLITELLVAWNKNPK